MVKKLYIVMACVGMVQLCQASQADAMEIDKEVKADSSSWVASGSSAGINQVSSAVVQPSAAALMHVPTEASQQSFIAGVSAANGGNCIEAKKMLTQWACGVYPPNEVEVKVKLLLDNMRNTRLPSLAIAPLSASDFTKDLIVGKDCFFNKKYFKALRHLSKAAQDDAPIEVRSEAKLFLGEIHYYGYMGQDYKKALGYFTQANNDKAAPEVQGEAQVLIGEMHLKAFAVDENRDLALFYLNKGSATAQPALRKHAQKLIDKIHASYCWPEKAESSVQSTAAQASALPGRSSVSIFDEGCARQALENGKQALELEEYSRARGFFIEVNNGGDIPIEVQREAQFGLGEVFLRGDNDIKDLNQARSYYKQANQEDAHVDIREWATMRLNQMDPFLFEVPSAASSSIAQPAAMQSQSSAAASSSVAAPQTSGMVRSERVEGEKKDGESLAKKSKK